MSDTPDLEPHEILERNRLNLITGLRMAQPMIDGLQRRDDAAVHAAGKSIIENFLQVLDRDALEQLALTALMNLAAHHPRPRAGRPSPGTAFTKPKDNQ